MATFVFTLHVPRTSASLEQEQESHVAHPVSCSTGHVLLLAVYYFMPL